ncbi:MAG: hypothetical protein CME26_15740 [Gemmatimonadetes bacterium]|nr:hypothetical protein [Gemmatimonadota bacterium]|tara:strand:- start:24545 stop:24895 length:351 start_codon:yes stop_codon:yes gene_type:complete
MNADIKVKAPRKSVAQDLLSKTRVKMNKSGSESVIDVQRPRTRDNQSIHIDIDIEAPRRLAYRFKTHNGSVVVHLVEVTGPVCSIETHNGKIDLDAPEDLSARVSVRAHNGSIKLR